MRVSGGKQLASWLIYNMMSVTEHPHSTAGLQAQCLVMGRRLFLLLVQPLCFTEVGLLVLERKLQISAVEL